MPALLRAFESCRQTQPRLVLVLQGDQHDGRSWGLHAVIDPFPFQSFLFEIRVH
jgi:hypothetical protein